MAVLRRSIFFNAGAPSMPIAATKACTEGEEGEEGEEGVEGEDSYRQKGVKCPQCEGARCPVSGVGFQCQGAVFIIQVVLPSNSVWKGFAPFAASRYLSVPMYQCINGNMHVTMYQCINGTIAYDGHSHSHLQSEVPQPVVVGEVEFGEGRRRLDEGGDRLDAFVGEAVVGQVQLWRGGRKMETYNLY